MFTQQLQPIIERLEIIKITHQNSEKRSQHAYQSKSSNQTRQPYRRIQNILIRCL